MTQAASGRPDRRIRLGVLFGGESPEHDVSVASAQEVLRSLDARVFDVRPVEISRAGRWRQLTGERAVETSDDGTATERSPIALEDRGLERTIAGENPVDCVFVALHGGDGEDGRIQGLLDCLRVPYTGSGVAASAICMDKLHFKTLLRGAGLPTPSWREIRRRDWQRDSSATMVDVADRIGFPCFVKSANSGSSLGVFRVEEPSCLAQAIERALQFDHRLLVEPEVVGRELTCAVLGNSGDPDLLPLPPIEIRPKVAAYFDYDAKYRPGASEEICPAPLEASQTRRVQELAVALHELAGCDGMSRADMILDETGELQVLEVNTIPGLTPTSLLPQAAREAGLAFPQLIERLIELALRRFERPPTR